MSRTQHRRKRNETNNIYTSERSAMRSSSSLYDSRTTNVIKTLNSFLAVHRDKMKLKLHVHQLERPSGGDYHSTGF